MTAGNALKTNKQRTPEWKISDASLWDIVSTTVEKIRLKDLWDEDREGDKRILVVFQPWFENNNSNFLKQSGFF